MVNKKVDVLSCDKGKHCLSGTNGVAAKFNQNNESHRESIIYGRCFKCRSQFGLPNHHSLRGGGGAHLQFDIPQTDYPSSKKEALADDETLEEEFSHAKQGYHGIELENINEAITQDHAHRDLTQFSDLSSPQILDRLEAMERQESLVDEEEDMEPHDPKKFTSEADLKRSLYANLSSDKLVDEGFRVDPSFIAKGVSALDQVSVANYAKRFLGKHPKSYAEALSVVAHSRKDRDLYDADIIDSQDYIDSIVSRYTSVTQASIAVALNFNENVILIDGKTVGASNAMEVANKEGLTAMVFDASKDDIDNLIFHLTDIDDFSDPRRMIIVSNLSEAHRDVKSTLANAITQREINFRPIPPNVHIVLTEKAHFNHSELPVNIVSQAIYFNGFKRSSYETAKAVTSTRIERLRKQMHDAISMNQWEKADRLKALLEQEGFTGEGVVSSASDAEKLINNQIESKIDEMATLTGEDHKVEKISILSDIITPQVSKGRSALYKKMLTGYLGRAKTESILNHQTSRNKYRAFQSLNINRMMAGECSLEEIIEVARKDRAYLSALVDEYNNSDIVESAIASGRHMQAFRTLSRLMEEAGFNNIRPLPKVKNVGDLMNKDGKGLN